MTGPAVGRRTFLRRWASALGLVAAWRLLAMPTASAETPDEPSVDPTEPVELAVESEALRFRLQLDRPTGSVRLAELTAFGRAWAPPTGSGPGGLWIDGLQHGSDRFGGLDGGEGFAALATRPGGLDLEHVESGLRLGVDVLTAGPSALVSRLTLANGRDEGAVTIGTAATLSWPLALGDRLEAIATDDAPSQWSQLSAGLPGGYANDGVRSGEAGVYPVVRLEDGGGDGIIVAVDTATSWRIDVGLAGGLRVLRAGELTTEVDLAPGEQVALPEVVTIFYRGGREGAVGALREYLEQVAALPPTGWSCPPVVFNTWFGYGTAVGDDGSRKSRLRQLARRAADVGVEAFVVDAGWYLGSPIPDTRSGRPQDPDEADEASPSRTTATRDLPELQRNDFDAGLGTWVEEPSKWSARPGDGGSPYGGLRNFSDYVHGLDVVRGDGRPGGKLKFGLWIEPERFDVLLHRPERVPDDWSIRGTPLLDLARPEVVEGLTERIQWLIDAYRVDYLKIDANLGVGSEASFGRRGHFWTRYSAGLEQLYTNLRAANPGLFLEHCASGLKRYWIGMPRLVHASWLDDDVQVDRVARVLEATDLLMLPRNKIALVTEDLSRYNSEPVEEGGVERDYDATAEMIQIIRAYWGGDRRNGGVIGFSDRLDLWGEEQLGAARRAIGQWKREVRGDER